MSEMQKMLLKSSKEKIFTVQGSISSGQKEVEDTILTTDLLEMTSVTNVEKGVTLHVIAENVAEEVEACLDEEEEDVVVAGADIEADHQEEVMTETAARVLDEVVEVGVEVAHHEEKVLQVQEVDLVV